MSLQVWLPLNGSLENKGLTSATITNNNATIDSSGKIGSCYSFNNSDSMIKIEGDFLSTMKTKTAFTISFWLYSNDLGNRSIYFATNTGTANVFGFALEKTTGELLRFYWQGSPDINFSTFSIPDQEWVHIACVYKNDNVYCYKNGVLTASRTDGTIKTSALTNTWSYASLGRDYRTGSTTLNGKLNDFRWYDNALSEKEIKEIAKGLVLHLPLNNNGLGNENILFNTNDLTLWNKESGVTINWDSDQQMYKMVVDKTNNTSRWGIYQNFTVTPNTTYTFSVEGLKGDHVTTMAVGTAKSSIGWPTNRYTFKTIKTKGIYTFTSGASDTIGRIYLTLSPTPDTGNKTAWFLHPKLELGDKATPYSPNPADEDYPATGSGISENLFAATDMSESLVSYSSSTDWTKHFRLYNGSASIHTIDTTEMTDTIALTTANSNLGIAFARLNSEINLDPTQDYTISCEAKCTNANLKLCIGLSYYNDQSAWVWRGGSNAKTFTSANTWQKITHTFKPDANTYAICYCFTINPGASPTGTDTFSIRKCKLEKGSTATEWQPSPVDDSYKTLGYYNNISFDQSGYNHNAVKHGVLSLLSDSPKYNVGTHISDNTHYIKIDGLSTSGFGDSYSFAWWGKINNFNYMQWGFGDGIRLNGMYTGVLWNTGDGSNNPLYKIGTTTQVTAPSLNTWHHYVMTGNGTKCYVYLDGELWAEAKTYKSISGTTIYINGWNDTSQYSSNNFSIQDFRIYATALSEDDVRSLYNNNAYIDSDGKIYGKIR